MHPNTKVLDFQGLFVFLEHQQKWGYLKQRVAGGVGHTVGVLSDGSVAGCGANGELQLQNIDRWHHIVAVDCGLSSTWAIDSDGKIHFTGTWFGDDDRPNSDEGVKGVLSSSSGTIPGNWTKKVVSVSCSMHNDFHMVSLREDGGVYAFGYKCKYDQCDVEGWCDMIQVIAYRNATIGVRRDGTVVCCGDCRELEGVSQWTNIEHIVVGKLYDGVMGVKYDGTVEYSGDGKWDVSSWRDVISVSMDENGAMGLTGAGHVYFAGNFPQHLIQNGLDGYLSIQCGVAGLYYALAPDHTFTYSNYTEREQKMDSLVLLSIGVGFFQTMFISVTGHVITMIPDEYDGGQADTDDWNLIPPAERKDPPQSKDSDNPPKQGSGCCYVATCVYGSYDCPEVWTLRRYRDDTLASTRRGRLFIKTYYAISPTAVKWFGSTAWFRKFWRSRLDRMVKKLNDRGVENTAYEDRSIF